MRRQGFTLVELLVVVAILTILVALLLPGLAQARDEALTVSCASRMKQIHLYAECFRADRGFYVTCQSWDPRVPSDVRNMVQCLAPYIPSSLKGEYYDPALYWHYFGWGRPYPDATASADNHLLIDPGSQYSYSTVKSIYAAGGSAPISYEYYRRHHGLWNWVSCYFTSRWFGYGNGEQYSVALKSLRQTYPIAQFYEAHDSAFTTLPLGFSPTAFNHGPEGPFASNPPYITPVGSRTNVVYTDGHIQRFSHPTNPLTLGPFAKDQIRWW